MSKWTRVVPFLILCCIVGIGIGYSAETVKSVVSMPLFGHPDKAGFDQIMQELAQLGEYEALASNCGGGFDARSILGSEAAVIRNLQKKNALDAGVLKVAEAKLLVRQMVAVEDGQHPADQSEIAGQIRARLNEAGWQDQSVTHVRSLVQELDQNQCQQPGAGGAR